jgi:TatD DNase family protein
MEFVDTHCHIQFADYPLDPDQTIAAAADAGVNRLMIVGCRLKDSQSAVEFVKSRENCWATIGLHPHEGAVYVHDHNALQAFRELASKPKVVAIGETGLDYYYEHSPREDQLKLLRFQLEMAQEFDLPLIFHIRDAFDDFWPVFDDFEGLRGVVHSFSSSTQDLEQIVKRGLYVGLNGIMTFTKRQDQLDAAKAVPLDKLLLETDAPFLTPTPYRGKIGESKYIRTIAEFLAELRGEPLKDVAEATTSNAIKLFKLS